MATNLVVGDRLELVAACFCAGQAGLNVTNWYVTSVGATAQTDLDFAIYMNALLADRYKSWLGNDAVWYGVKVSIKNRPQLPMPVTRATSVGTGLGVGGALPGQVCGLLTLATLFSGRRYRGRLYLPFPRVAFNDAILNIPTVDALTAGNVIGTAYSTVATLGSGDSEATITPVVKSAFVATGSSVKYAFTRQRWATQRRRGNYGRPNVYPPF